MGMGKVRWTGHEKNKLQTRETLLYSGKNEERHEAGVGLLLAKKFAGMETCVRPHHHSALRVTLQEGVCYYVLCTNQHTWREKKKDSFYAQLLSVLDKILNWDMLMGDMNAKVESDNTDREREDTDLEKWTKMGRC